jgi:hypothetical protein
MKSPLTIFLIVAIVTAFQTSCSAGRDPQYDQIRSHLQNDIEYLKAETVNEEITPEKVWEESDKEWALVLAKFRAMLALQGLGDRDDLIASKEQVHEAWKRRCRILLDQLTEKSAVLRRYNEGPEGSTGYVILVDGKPKYWLHRRFNRERDNY